MPRSGGVGDAQRSRCVDGGDERPVLGRREDLYLSGHFLSRARGGTRPPAWHGAQTARRRAITKHAQDPRPMSAACPSTCTTDGTGAVRPIPKACGSHPSHAALACPSRCVGTRSCHTAVTEVLLAPPPPLRPTSRGRALGRGGHRYIKHRTYVKEGHEDCLQTKVAEAR